MAEGLAGLEEYLQNFAEWATTSVQRNDESRVPVDRIKQNAEEALLKYIYNFRESVVRNAYNGLQIDLNLPIPGYYRVFRRRFVNMRTRNRATKITFLQSSSPTEQTAGAEKRFFF